MIVQARAPSSFEATAIDITRDTFDFVQHASKARSALDLQQRFERFVRAFGYPYYCCVEIKAPGGILVGEELFGRLHPEWHERYFSHEYSRHDAVLSDAIHQDQPFFWTDIAKRRRLTDGEQLVFSEVKEFSSFEGFCVPIHGLDGSLSVVSLFGEERVDRSPDSFTALHMVSLAYGGAARRLKAIQRMDAFPIGRLTARQAEIVRYIATGHHVEEIASRLSISENTVRNHLADAKERYNARTLAQLSVECTRNREFVL